MANIVPGTRGAEKPRVFLWEAAAAAVRVVGNADAPWFVAKDVCAALGIANYRDAAASLEDDEKGVALTDTLGGPQEMATVNESGLYALIFRSRKEQARVFRKWVTSEVLPAIRKTGAYAAPGVSLAPRALPVGRVEILHARPELPAPPTEEQLVADLLFTALGSRSIVVVRGGTLVDLAMRDQAFTGWFKDEHEGYLRTAGFMRRLVAYFNRPLSTTRGASRFVHLAPHARGRHRRYIISRLDSATTPSDHVETREAVEIIARALRASGEVIVK